MGVFTSFQQQLTKTITRLEYPELPPYRWSPIKEKSFISVLPTKDGLAPVPLINPKILPTQMQVLLHLKEPIQILGIILLQVVK